VSAVFLAPAAIVLGERARDFLRGDGMNPRTNDVIIAKFAYPDTSSEIEHVDCSLALGTARAAVVGGVALRALSTSSSCCEIKYHPTFNLPASHPFEYAIDVLKLVGTDRRLYFAGAGEVERFLQVETRPDDRSPHRKAARAIEKARRIEGARRAGTCLRWCSRGRTGNRSAQKING
jgi:hypothetical protein